LYGRETGQVLTRWVANGANAGVAYYLTDRLGSVRDVLDGTGTMQDHLDYSGFGVVTESNAAYGDHIQYTGLRDDGDTGLVTADNRVYNPLIARWYTEDPIAFQGGDGNLYRYVGNNATNATDPTGLVKKLEKKEVGNRTALFQVENGRPPLSD